jgi:drug/metabolite transporter (DMT)-like permease
LRINNLGATEEMKIVTLVMLLLISGSACTGNAQSSSPSSSSESTTREDNNSPQSEANDAINKSPPSASSGGHYPSSREFILTILVSVLGLIALAMEFLMLRRLTKLKAEDVLRVFAVTLILIGTLFFIVAGFDSNQIAPAMGLFGTVAGYLLGRSIDRKEDKGGD